MDWTDRFRIWMRERELSQAKIAKRMGLTQEAISHWLTRKRDIPLKEFLRLCAAAEADVCTILSGQAAENRKIKLIKDILEAKELTDTLDLSLPSRRSK